jgi:hypothetical protein
MRMRGQNKTRKTTATRINSRTSKEIMACVVMVHDTKTLQNNACCFTMGMKGLAIKD